MKKNILLLSGGCDSVYLLHHFKKTNFDFIYFIYGQKYYKQEKLVIEKIEKEYGKVVECIDLGKLETKENGFVLGRNLYFLIEVAKKYPEATIWIGTNKDDTFGDNNVRFYKKAVFVVNKSFGSKIKIKLPLKDTPKKEIVKWVIDNKIETYYCYEGGEKPCGKCKGCLQFENNKQ